MARTTHETRFLLSAKDSTKAVFKGVRGGLASVGRSVTGLQAQLLGLAGIGGLGVLTKNLIETNAEFQTIKSSLKTVTGGTKEAAAAFELIEEFATTTPFDLQQVTQSFIKLKALGLDPSESALRSYGNTASAMGKSLDQMIEAVADASTGEFERLKEFGIRASKQGDQIAFTFQGITETVAFNSDAIQGYLRGIGDTNFGSAMSDQMQNLTPAFSNFSAAVDGLFVAVGEAGLNEALADLTNNTTAWIRSLDPEKVASFSKAVIGYFEDIADAAGFVTDSIAETNLILSGDAKSAFPGGRSDYQLGDFNKAFPVPAGTFDEWADAIRENTGAIRDQNNGARAG